MGAPGGLFPWLAVAMVSPPLPRLHNCPYKSVALGLFRRWRPPRRVLAASQRWRLRPLAGTGRGLGGHARSPRRAWTRRGGGGGGLGPLLLVEVGFPPGAGPRRGGVRGGEWGGGGRGRG